MEQAEKLFCSEVKVLRFLNVSLFSKVIVSVVDKISVVISVAAEAIFSKVWKAKLREIMMNGKTFLIQG